MFKRQRVKYKVCIRPEQKKQKKEEEYAGITCAATGTADYNSKCRCLVKWLVHDISTSVNYSCTSCCTRSKNKKKKSQPPERFDNFRTFPRILGRITGKPN